MVNRREVKNSQNPYAVGLREYDTTVGHVLRVISCMHLEVIFKVMDSEPTVGLRI